MGNTHHYQCRAIENSEIEENCKVNRLSIFELFQYTTFDPADANFFDYYQLIENGYCSIHEGKFICDYTGQTPDDFPLHHLEAITSLFEEVNLECFWVDLYTLGHEGVDDMICQQVDDSNVDEVLQMEVIKCQDDNQNLTPQEQSQYQSSIASTFSVDAEDVTLESQPTENQDCLEDRRRRLLNSNDSNIHYNALEIVIQVRKINTDGFTVDQKSEFLMNSCGVMYELFSIEYGECTLEITFEIIEQTPTTLPTAIPTISPTISPTGTPSSLSTRSPTKSVGNRVTIVIAFLFTLFMIIYGGYH